jgi:hypothetical protein
MSQPKNLGIRPIFRLNNERKSWDRLYEAFEPSCSMCDQLSEDFWWLSEREPWKRVSAEIAAEGTISAVLASAETAVRFRLAMEKTSEGGPGKTRH